ncbi:stage II sporulation protein E [Paenibacillus faecis]|uniref:Stage II sporulation protein E n=1 Tax=Paenibacillus faecis TaxID=862114 RepID=A0A5D0CR70_9BACL|nr:stage II sporulation protein E [Paenibacillus faecis]TYA12479.1 stage II sporulation protein E [Paenibacillus faecis]GIO88261.1 stage II sporulation protein E [Paenibacillus faecis]
MEKWNVIPFPGMKKAKGQAGEVSWDGWKQIPFVAACSRMFAANKWTGLLLLMSFLLGKATILDELAPFAAAFFAVMMFMRRDIAVVTGALMIAGALFVSGHHAAVIAAELLIFYLIHKGMESFERAELSYAPLMVFTSTFFALLFTAVIGPSLTWYALVVTVMDAILSFVLTLVFIQAVPVFTYRKRNYQLRTEEIVCLVILLASIMTGTVGWEIGGLSIEHILTRYLILLFALVGGAALGASVGVVTGLILSLADTSALYQMSLLAFSGMLAGMMREGRRWAVGFGMLLGSSILSIYLAGPAEVMSSTWESCAAVLLFLLTPRSVISAIAKYIPGTQDHTNTQHEYAKRMREITAGRVAQFSEVFKQLSRSFGQIASSGEIAKRSEEVDHFMNAVTEGACATCFRRNACWDGKFYQTYKYMTEMMTAVEETPEITKDELPPKWDKICIKTDQVLALMKREYNLYQHDMHWKRQIYDSRLLVAEQLSGVSQVMEDLAREIQREGQALYKQEEQIREALEKMGLSIHNIDIVNLDHGNVEIEIVHAYTRGYDECRKIIAPLLSDILGEHIAVVGEVMSDRRDGLATVTFGSAKTYEITTGVAGAAKGGDLLSGDSFSARELGNGTYAVALSDGMGNGERARLESSTALSILEQLLQSGMDETLAIKSVNSVLMLRSPDEVYATVDMALIDEYSARTTFLKIGSSPSFIKRGNEVIPITASNLPIGIIQDIEVDLVTVQLYPGDTLIMMTDGVYDAPGYAVNKELWIKRLIQEIRSEDPQDIADGLLEAVIRYQKNTIQDDMTVAVAKVDHYLPQWSTLHIPGLSRLERPRTVS